MKDEGRRMNSIAVSSIRRVELGACPRAGLSSGRHCQKGVGSRFRHDVGSHYESFSRRNRLPTPFRGEHPRAAAGSRTGSEQTIPGKLRVQVAVGKSDCACGGCPLEAPIAPVGRGRQSRLLLARRSRNFRGSAKPIKGFSTYCRNGEIRWVRILGTATRSISFGSRRHICRRAWRRSRALPSNSSARAASRSTASRPTPTSNCCPGCPRCLI